MAECVLLVQFDDEWIAFLLERTKGLLILSQLGSRCKQGWVSAKYYLMDNHLYPEGIAI